MSTLRTPLVLALAFALAGTLARGQDLEIVIYEGADEIIIYNEITVPEPPLLNFEGFDQSGAPTSPTNLQEVLAPAADAHPTKRQQLPPPAASGVAVPVFVSDEILVVEDQNFDPDQIPDQPSAAATFVASVDQETEALIAALSQDPWCNLRKQAQLTQGLQNWITADAHASLRIPVAAWALCADLLTLGDQVAAPLQQILRLDRIPLRPTGPESPANLLALLAAELGELPQIPESALQRDQPLVGALPWPSGLRWIDTVEPGFTLMEINKADLPDISAAEGRHRVGLVTISALLPAGDSVLLVSVYGGADPQVPLSQLYGALRTARDRLSLATLQFAN